MKSSVAAWSCSVSHGKPAMTSAPIPAMHCGEDAVRAGLQRDVKVLRDAVVGGEEIDQFAGNVHWLDGADAETLDGGFVEDALQQIDKFDARGEIAAPGAEIDPAQDDFARAGGDESADFAENFVWSKAAAASAHEGNHAVRAAVVATILNFQDGACVTRNDAVEAGIVAGNGSGKDVRLFKDVAGEDFGGATRER